MTDKEINNIAEIKSYLAQKQVFNTGAYNICTAHVTYQGSGLEPIVLPKADVRYRHTFIPGVIIDQLQPPYYSEFRPDFQDFRYMDNALTIRGVDMNGRKYQLTII